jgi:hypothetical protein
VLLELDVVLLLDVVDDELLVLLLDVVDDELLVLDEELLVVLLLDEELLLEALPPKPPEPPPPWPTGPVPAAQEATTRSRAGAARRFMERRW